jgi:hypothetical protein
MKFELLEAEIRNRGGHRELAKYIIRVLGEGFPSLPVTVSASSVYVQHKAENALAKGRDKFFCSDNVHWMR